MCRRAGAPIVLLIAGGLLQVPMARAIKRCGYLLCVFDSDERCIGRDIADLFCACDIRSAERLVAAARAIRAVHAPRPIAAALTAATDFSRQVAAVNRALGIPSIPVAVAARTNDKARMRAVLQRRKIAVPQFAVVGDSDSRAAVPIALPAVVKPVDNMGGRGVRLILSDDQLFDAVRDAQAYSARSEVLVEQYITDPEYSVEMLVRNYVPYHFVVAARDIACQPFFIEMGHILPASLPSAAIRTIRLRCRQALRAMGIRDGVAKFDLFYANGAVTIGEVACRLSGGYMSGWTFPQSRGINISEAAVRQLTGRSGSFRAIAGRASIFHAIAGRSRRLGGGAAHRRRNGPRDGATHSGRNAAAGTYSRGASPHSRLRRSNAATRSRYRYSGECAMLSLPGRIAAIHGIAEARALPNVTHLFLRRRAGETAVFPVNNVQKCLNVIMVGASEDELWQTARAARLTIDIRLQPQHDDTLAFLFADDGKRFPMAYRAYPTLLQRLRDRGRDILSERARIPDADAAMVDWHRLSLADTLHSIRGEYPIAAIANGDELSIRPFWRALMKGGLQGARFYLDTLNRNRGLLSRWIARWDGNVGD